jgi:transposase
VAATAAVRASGHQIVLQEAIEAVRLSQARVVRLERTIAEFLPNWSLAPVVAALQALRGVGLIVAVTFVRHGFVTRPHRVKPP